MYLEIHPFERPEHGTKHSEDEVGPTEETIDHLEGGVDTKLEDPLERAEPRQGVGFEAFCWCLQQKAFSEV